MSQRPDRPVTRFNSNDKLADVPNAQYGALKARFAELAKVIETAGAERIEIWTEMERRKKEAANAVRLGSLRDVDRAALREQLDK